MAKHNIRLALLAAVMGMTLASCSSDEPSSQSIFDTTTTEPQTDFDRWLSANFTEPYNIRLYYLYNDKLSDNSYNVVPATTRNSIAMAKMIKHVWLDAYVEAAGEDFVKSNAFRVFQFIGSPEYNSQGSIVLGTAEGGIQVTLFRLNELDLDNIYVNQDEPFREHSELPLDLNYWYFHTMHHEFCHILTQKKNYTTDFQAISAGNYHSADWINVTDEEAVQQGFVTGYASGEYNEDFAEVYATYVTSSDRSWQARLQAAGESGAAILNQKLAIVRSYLADSWGIDLDNLRNIVLRRSAEVQNMDLTTLN